MEQNELIDEIAFGTQESDSSIDCGTTQDLTGDTELDRAERDHAVALDELDRLRRREEADFRARHGWGQILRSSEYAAMNRYVDAVVIVSNESRRVRETRSALYAASARVIEARQSSSKGGSR